MNDKKPASRGPKKPKARDAEQLPPSPEVVQHETAVEADHARHEATVQRHPAESRYVSGQDLTRMPLTRLQKHVS